MKKQKAAGLALPAEGMAGRLFSNARDRRQALDAEPGLHNVLGIERAFAERPLAMDFLDPSSPYFALKALSTKIYRRFLDPILARVPEDARVLDAGCGIGRFTVALAERFQNVVALDPSPSSLKACQNHLAQRGIDHVELHWADLSVLDDWPAGRFDLVVATELICYTADPAAALKRLVRVARPGALVFVSVEGRPGALTVQGADDPSTLMDALDGKPLLVEEDRFVIYMNSGELEKLALDAGLADLVLQGSHYFSEGPFWQSVEDDALGDPAYAERILQAEEKCRSDPTLAPLARVFCAAGRKG